MRILPVIDILNGTVVRGVGGRRDEYRPITSRYADSSDPLVITAGLNRIFGFQRYYVADLDGIMLRRPNSGLYRQLSSAGYELLIDAGIRHSADAQFALNSGAAAAVAGLETLPGAHALRELITAHTAKKIVFSLDLKVGSPQYAHDSQWGSTDPWAIIAEAVACGVTEMIVLDLADVGSGTGGSTAELCRNILQRFPGVRLIAGGGVRGEDDVDAWEKTGVSDLLIASALHDGRLSPEFVRKFA